MEALTSSLAVGWTLRIIIIIIDVCMYVVYDHHGGRGGASSSMSCVCVNHSTNQQVVWLCSGKTTRVLGLALL